MIDKVWLTGIKDSPVYDHIYPTLRIDDADGSMPIKTINLFVWLAGQQTYFYACEGGITYLGK